VALLTGSQASASGVTGEAVGEFRPERRRRSSPRTLAERLAARGYETVAFSNNPWVSDVTGLDAGFARFYAMATPRHFFLGVSRLLGRLRADPVEADDGATITAGAAARWVERHRDRPFFLFVNLIEAMPPWTPPNPFRDRALDGTKISDRTALRRAVLDPLAYSLGAVALDWRDTDLMRQLYDAEVAAADAAVAALLESLQRAGVLDRTVVVVTADHGFAFDSGTHYAGNKLTLSEGVLRVPLVIRGPGIASGKSLDVPVSTLDVVPTLMELAGAPPDRQAHGRSLVPLLRAEQVIAEFEGRPLIAEHRSPRFHLEAIKTVAPHLELDSLDRDQFAVVVGSRKLRFDSKGKSAVHDLEADPDEGNAAWADSEEGRIAARELKETYEAWRASHPPAPRAFDAARDAATMRVLNALPFSWLL
jgi:arylsulfatase A-like enzyme